MKKNSQKQVTIKDIAAMTGYSIATVSRVINNKDQFYSDEAKQSIEDAIKKLRYRPNVYAKGLKTNRAYSIAYMVPKIEEYYTEIFNGMQRIVNNTDYSIVLLNSNYSKKQEAIFINSLMEGRYDGVVIAAGLQNAERISDIRNAMPVICIDSIETAPDLITVSTDTRSIAREAVEHLIRLGHRRIAFLSEPILFSSIHNRLEGYKEALVAYGIPDDEGLVHADEALSMFDYEKVYCLLNRIFDQGGFTALFCISDPAALAAIRVAKEHGLRVPRDVSIFGFDDVPFASYIDPPLSSVSQDANAMGAYAMRMILDIMSGEPTSSVVLKANLKIRESIGPVKK